MDKFDDRKILSACAAYSAAKAKCLSIDAEIARLATEGNHKKKNKIIHTEGVKASQRKNQALRALTDLLDAGSREVVDS